MGKMSTKFDFLVNLFKTNEKAFNEYQADAVEEYISTLPPDRAEKMRAFQDTIIDELNTCETHADRFSRMNEMFVEQTDVFAKTMDKFNKALK